MGLSPTQQTTHKAHPRVCRLKRVGLEVLPWTLEVATLGFGEYKEHIQGHHRRRSHLYESRS